MNPRNSDSIRYAVIIPVCNEEACLGPVLDELIEKWPGRGRVIAVGLNGATDQSASIARNRGVIVGESEMRGYGHGCLAAIGALDTAGQAYDALLFVSGDGASAPEDLPKLLEAYEAGYDLVLGSRTTLRQFPSRPWRRTLANLALGLWASLLARRIYTDLGPLRVIDRALFEKMALRERTWGWTIEPQVLAPRFGAKIASVAVRERPRLAGEQKISGVSWAQSLRVGREIVAAGWRAARRSIRP